MPAFQDLPAAWTAVRRWFTEARAETGSLRDLDRRTLADIGIHPSEIGSIEAEARGCSESTRRRIVHEWHRA